MLHKQRIYYYLRRRLENFYGQLCARRSRFIPWLLSLVLVGVFYGSTSALAGDPSCVADATNYQDLRAPWNNIDDHNLCDYDEGFLHVPEYRLCCSDLTLQPSQVTFILARLVAEFIAVSFVHVFGISVVYMVK